MPISKATENKLRDAMKRLRDGAPLHTDGALTKENLAREAGVSHATVHRAHTILAEWNTQIQPTARDTAAVHSHDSADELRAKLRDANQKITTLNGKLDALASVTANLYHENRALRATLERHAPVVALDPARRRTTHTDHPAPQPTLH
jgi:hypothetical protein